MSDTEEKKNTSPVKTEPSSTAAASSAAAPSILASVTAAVAPTPAAKPTSTSAPVNTTTSTSSNAPVTATTAASTSSPALKAPKVPTSEYDYFIVLDFEATCDDHKPTSELLVTPATSEIIEFSWLCVSKNTLAIVHEEQRYVKPVNTVLTPFCKNLTKITEETLADAGTLLEAVSSMDDYINQHILGENKTFCFVTHGAWDLRIQLPREAKDKGIQLASYLVDPILFDLKEEATKWIAHHSEVVLRSFSLEKMCEAFAVSQVGTLHSGLDDAKTIVNIMKYLVAFAHPDVFTQATDPALLLKLFKTEESKVVKISSLSYDVTQTELETFFATHQLKPKELIMLSHNSNRPSGGGFAVFEKHSDALAALDLNGKVLGTRSIEVAPSSKDAMALQKGKLSSFQATPRPPPVSRPGDWTCNMCQFVNFSSRRACLKCNSPSPEGVIPLQPANFTSGDWMCTNAQCNFHNYASRTQCLRCGSLRPGVSGGSGYGNGNGGPMASPHHHSHHNHHHHPYASGGGGGGGAPSITFRPGDWNCPNCNFQNFASRSVCMKCSTSMPGGGGGNGGHGGNNYNSGRGNSGYGGYGDNGNQGGYGNGGRGGYSSGGSMHQGGSSYSGGGSNGHSFRPGDWTCPSCNSHNFASRFQCMRCNLAKPSPRDSSSPAPNYGQQQGGMGGLKPGDWLCPNGQCGYHNFAKRSSCARCGTSSPNQGGNIGGNIGGIGGGGGGIGGGSNMGYYGTQHQASPQPQSSVQSQPGYSPLNPSYGSYGGPTYGSQQPQQGYGSYGSQYGAPNRY
ncbi:hypothetical protein BGZ94_000841 [Podila epigama]|nr:hypothetical protein BGZ94_000841 [Podila epigama]